MARPRRSQPVQHFVGLLSGDADLLRRARQLLTKRYGPVEQGSDHWPFDQTDYYRDEMGPDLLRWFISFERMIVPEDLVDIKHETNALEAHIGEQALLPEIPRPVNIDPGYLAESKLVLATTKDAGHRLYMARGIYAEVTLQYAHGGWQVQPWTYPDYAQDRAHAFFSLVRQRYLEKRRQFADTMFNQPDPS